MTERSHQCLMMTPNTGPLPASAETSSCYCTKTTNKIREHSHFRKEINRLIYTTRIFGLWRKLRVCAIVILIYRWNPHVKTFHKFLLKRGDTKLHPVIFSVNFIVYNFVILACFAVVCCTLCAPNFNMAGDGCLHWAKCVLTGRDSQK